MAMVWQREVEDYQVDVFRASTLNYMRSIRLRLKPTASEPVHTISIQFPLVVPTDFVNIGSSFSEIKMPFSDYDEIYHLLQTEKPVYFTAYEFDALRFAGLTTDHEGTGEGFKDPNAP